ncbi:conserved hypothetical protein [Formosa agariphila KMM 3901]|uniref:Uncharacterized protein n=1 Tax=Formosa agariphila (strain DSM 15362 / KCTC 12365 / LMG 23005 / KMM 3901 / M-2Alg 35-1) TaxID=1347342 RepID=T2KLZ1_FORAG|nr:hypothetical protein [Formosa agariphila]CDF79483.1 conserved hypothetical protein [Formosa agariphila KMM 3901]
MNIKYNDIDKTIEIKDGMKNYYFIMKILMVLNLLNAMLNLFDVYKTGFGFIEIVWLVLGLISIVVLYLFIFKKSTSEKIPIDTIKGLSETSIFGRTRFSVELKNGKKRDLNDIKTQKEFNALKKMFNKNRIVNLKS